MSEYSKTRRQNHRVDTPAVAANSSESSDSEREAPHGPNAAAPRGDHDVNSSTANAIGEAPGSPAYYGRQAHATLQGEERPASPQHLPTRSVAPALNPKGDPPGSPQYYGRATQTATHREAPENQPGYPPSTRFATPTIKPIGEPAGTASYYGHAPQSVPERRGSESVGRGYGNTERAAGRALQPIGEPPGSALYFGQKAAAVGHLSAQAAPHSRETMSRSPIGRSIGDPPGSPSYFGQSIQLEQPGHAQMPFPGGRSPTPAPRGGSRAAGPFAAVGTAPGSAAYFGIVTHRRPGGA
jgi:hypothetical protein